MKIFTRMLVLLLLVVLLFEGWLFPVSSNLDISNANTGFVNV